MTEKPGKLPKVNDWDNIVRVINKSPKNFCILQANSGFFGSTIYRAIIGSSTDKSVASQRGSSTGSDIVEVSSGIGS